MCRLKQSFSWDWNACSAPKAFDVFDEDEKFDLIIKFEWNENGYYSNH
jgi:hypothetical protein